PQPAAPAAPEPETAAPPSGDLAESAIMSPPVRSVLVVDDTEAYLRALAGCLQDDGIHVHAAGNPDDAVRLLTPRHSGAGGRSDLDDPGRIALALLDVNLHGDPLGGLRLAQRIQQLRPDIRIVLMTGDLESHQSLSKADGMGLRVHGFISK